MKKFFALLLSLAILFGLVACAQGGSDAAGETTASGNEFLVGYSKVNITPEYSVPLRGYGNPTERMSTGYLDYLYATCAAITDTDGNTVVVFGIDLTNAFESYNLFPPMMIQMITIGERTNSLDDVLTRSCTFFDAQVETSMNSLTNKIQPIMLMIMGVIIGTLFLATYSPMITIMTELDV